MQKGGVDIIELGVPFSDPIADGPAIQETNTVRSIPSSLSTFVLKYARFPFTMTSIMRLCSVRLEKHANKVLLFPCCSWVSRYFPQIAMSLNPAICRLLQSHDRLWRR